MTTALNLLGLARRAGGVCPGAAATRRSIRQGTARLVVAAADAADGQLAKVERTARGHGVPLRIVSEREVLGTTVGRGPTTALAVTHPGLAERILLDLDNRTSAANGVGAQGR